MFQSLGYDTQASKDNIKNIVKIKENFLKLSVQKVEKIHKVLNNMRKDKLRINMTMKGLSRKQVIVLMSSNNTERAMAKLNILLHSVFQPHMSLPMDNHQSSSIPPDSFQYGSKPAMLSQMSLLVQVNSMDIYLLTFEDHK